MEKKETLFIDVDLTKFGFATMGDFAVNINGEVKRKKFNRLVGCYNSGRKGSYIKYMGKTFMIKTLIAAAFIHQYDYNKYNVITIDNDESNCSLSNIKIDLKREFKKIVYSEETYKIYVNMIEDLSIRKIFFYIFSKFDLYISYYDDDDFYQEVLMYLFERLEDYDTNKERYCNDFKKFLCFKIYDYLHEKCMEQKRKIQTISIDMATVFINKKKNNVLQKQYENC